MNMVPELLQTSPRSATKSVHHPEISTVLYVICCEFDASSQDVQQQTTMHNTKLGRPIYWRRAWTACHAAWAGGAPWVWLESGLRRRRPLMGRRRQAREQELGAVAMCIQGPAWHLGRPPLARPGHRSGQGRRGDLLYSKGLCMSTS